MKHLLNIKTQKSTEIIDGFCIDSETPTLFTDNATIKSINKTLNKKISKRSHELESVILKRCRPI